MFLSFLTLFLISFVLPSFAPSTLRPPLKEEIEMQLFFIQLGLPSTLIRHENGAFLKRSSDWRNLKTPALLLSVDGKHLQKGACVFLTRVFLKHKSKMLF